MKKLTVAIAALTVAAGISAQNYRIEGSYPGHDGTKVQIVGSDKSVIDSTVVVDGKFLLTNPLTAVQAASLRVGDNGKDAFILYEKPITVTCTEKEVVDRSGTPAIVTEIDFNGDPEQAIHDRVSNAVLMDVLMMFSVGMSAQDTTLNAQERESIKAAFAQARESKERLLDSVATNCTDNYATALAMLEHLAPNLKYPEMEKLWNGLTPRVQQSAIGQQLNAKIQELKAVSMGSEAPDFSLPTPEGGQLSLKEALKGKKALLIDFWASWCGPCLREAPNIKNVYSKYKDKGFEVLSVSLDDNAPAWTDAIKNHGLNWLHISALKGWDCPVAKIYNVTAVPAMFLLDGDGRIVSTNARGEQLEIEVAKLCK